MSADRECAIIVFAKRPSTGRVKTRLARTIGADNARLVYEQLLNRALQNVEHNNAWSKYLYVDRLADRDYFHNRLDSGWTVSNQQGRSIGERMHHALVTVLKRHRRAILIGSDIADGTPDDIDNANRLLSSNDVDVVFGPVADGGYWLIGIKQPNIELFRDVPWSTPLVRRVTTDRCGAMGLKVAELALRHDIDEARDLLRFAHEIRY